MARRLSFFRLCLNVLYSALDDLSALPAARLAPNHQRIPRYLHLQGVYAEPNKVAVGNIVFNFEVSSLIKAWFRSSTN